MPVISAQVVQRLRKPWVCGMCGKRIEGRHIRMYGYAEPGEKPYAIHVHDSADCGAQMPDVRAALHRTKGPDHV